MVADCEFGGGETIALGVEEAHGVLGEVAAVGGLPFVVKVGEDGADEADGGGFVGGLSLGQLARVWLSALDVR